ncbi:MAG: hypothetical protein AB1700_11475 [Bacillota bacterium]
MSHDAETAKRIAQVLRRLAAKLEENPALVDGLGLTVEDVPRVVRHRKEQKSSLELDIFRAYSEGGEEALRALLTPLDLRALKSIVRQHGFDPSRLADKWRKKDRLVALIVDRVASRSEKGKVFKEYP